jgi:hypothetical protein
MATSPALRFEAKGEGVLVGECAAFLPLQHVERDAIQNVPDALMHLHSRDPINHSNYDGC